MAPALFVNPRARSRRRQAACVRPQASSTFSVRRCLVAASASRPIVRQCLACALCSPPQGYGFELTTERPGILSLDVRRHPPTAILAGAWSPCRTSHGSPSTWSPLNSSAICSSRSPATSLTNGKGHSASAPETGLHKAFHLAWVGSSTRGAEELWSWACRLSVSMRVGVGSKLRREDESDGRPSLALSHLSLA